MSETDRPEIRSSPETTRSTAMICAPIRWKSVVVAQ
jgi:hypothetical protein